MKDFRLYVVADNRAVGHKNIIEVVEAALKGGADIIQLRDKSASVREMIKIGRQMRSLTRRTKTLFIVNDRPDIALALEADGVHLGQDDLPLAIARQILGPDKIIGLSTHSLQQALEAREKGADYIGLGPVFATPTKEEYSPVGLSLISQVKEKINIPFVAIGGINETNIDEVIAAGAWRVAVVRAVMSAEDSAGATRRLKEKIEKVKNGGRT